jgi:Flp pilus assembly protein TadG
VVTRSRVARGRGERGAAAVEFGLVLLPLLYLVLGIIQYGVYFWSMNSGSNAVGDEVRRMAVGDCQTATERKQFLHGRLGSATTSTVSAISTTVVYLNPDGSSAASAVIGGTVRLTGTYAAPNFHFPLIPVPSGGQVSRTFDARIEDLDATAGGCS